MLISVIIPVYNADKYLTACIDSVLAQQMADFELLLIDDGSKDSSPDICDRYAAQDTRIRVFHTPNRGVSAARNLGLENARGEYITFIDSDDWVDPDHLQQYLDSGIAEDGIAFSNMRKERSQDDTQHSAYPLPDCRAEGGHAQCMPILARVQRARSIGWCCNKLFSRATIERHKLRFDPAYNYAEDEIFTIQYCAHITHIVCNSHPTYHYRFVEGSLINRNNAPLKIMHTRQYIDSEYERLGYDDEVIYLSARTRFSRLKRELRHAKWSSEIANQLAQGLLDNWRFYRKYARAAYRKNFYDTKVFYLGWLICGLNSPAWIKLSAKGLRL